MKASIHRFPRRGAAAWADLVKDWQESGLSAEQFAAQNDMTVTTLENWARRLRKSRPHNSGSERRPAFAQVRIAQPATARTERSAPERTAIEVVLGHGRLVRVIGAVDPKDLATVLAVVEGGTTC